MILKPLSHSEALIGNDKIDLSSDDDVFIIEEIILILLMKLKRYGIVWMGVDNK
jgi:hypothetical protein